MEEVIHYLELKNQYYEKFYNLTQKFLQLAEDKRWNDVELFVDNRERILSIIRSYDFKIAEVFEQIDVTQVDLNLYRTRVHSLLESRKSWVDKIVALDLELISKVEDMKSETIKELKKTVETHNQINSFKDTILPFKRKEA